MTLAKPAPMWGVDASSFRFIVANDDAARFFGYTKEKLLRLSIYDILVPEERERFRMAFSQRSCYGDAGEWTCRLPNNQRFRVAVRSYEALIEGSLAIIAWAVSVFGHPVCCSPILPEVAGPLISDDSRAHRFVS